MYPYPRACQTNLIVNLQDETVIYNEQTHQAHYLNQVAGEVWLMSDGESDAATIAAQISEKLGTPCNTDAVQLAWEQLSRRDLLLEPLEPASHETKIGRRETLKRLALTLALPVIITVLARTAVAQASEPNGDDGGDGSDYSPDGGRDGGGGYDDGPSGDGGDGGGDYG